eukprot:4866302-Pyramimonas_sp.AAC.1
MLILQELGYGPERVLKAGCVVTRRAHDGLVDVQEDRKPAAEVAERIRGLYHEAPRQLESPSRQRTSSPR